jgi:membrane-associated phospholipid phosphatase
MGSGRLVYILGVVLLNVSLTHAQTSSPPKPPVQTESLERDFFKNILRDQKAIWTSPLHINRSDAKWMIPSAIGFGGLLATDRITGDEIAEANRQVSVSRAVSQMGSLYGLGAFAGTFYFIGREKKNARARETGLLSAEALVDSLIVGGAIKGISQRGRPLSGRERSEFFEGGNSFPSGHSIQAWSVATLVAHEYNDSRLVQVAAYGLASAVSVARFTVHKHYLSDVLAGSALGFGIGHYVYHARHKTTSADSDETDEVDARSWPTIVPMYSRHNSQYGVTLRWSF